MTALLGPGELIWGVQLPVQSQSTHYVEAWEAAAGPSDVRDAAQAAERAGAGYVAVCDHLAIPDDRVATMGATWWDTIATLAWLAAHTERVHLLSHVYVLAYRHPLAAAKAWSTLDTLSGGRAVLGVGAGHVREEFDALGVPFEQRGRLLDESIDAVRQAFASSSLAATGEGWAYAGLQARPRPQRPGGPPIWVGGSSPAALRRVAVRGDGWLPQGPPPEGMRAGVARLLELRAELGDGAALDIGANAAPMYVGDPTWETGPHTRVGVPEVLADGLVRLAGIGVNHVQVRMRSRDGAELVDQLEAFGTEVWPLVLSGVGTPSGPPGTGRDTTNEEA